MSAVVCVTVTPESSPADAEEDRTGGGTLKMLHERERMVRSGVLPLVVGMSGEGAVHD